MSSLMFVRTVVSEELKRTNVQTESRFMYIDHRFSTGFCTVQGSANKFMKIYFSLTMNWNMSDTIVAAIKILTFFFFWRTLPQV